MDMSAGHTLLTTLMADRSGAAEIARKTGIAANTLRKLLRTGARPSQKTRLALSSIVALSLWDQDEQPRTKPTPAKKEPRTTHVPEQAPVDPLILAYTEARAVYQTATTNRDLVRGLAGALTAVRACYSAAGSQPRHPLLDGFGDYLPTIRKALEAAGASTDCLDRFEASCEPDEVPYDLREAIDDIQAQAQRALSLDLSTTDRLLATNTLSGVAKVRALLDARDDEQHPALTLLNEELTATVLSRPSPSITRYLNVLDGTALAPHERPNKPEQETNAKV